MAELKKLLNILIACTKKVYSQMMSLFFCLLSACSCAGSVDEAMSCYTPMIRVYMGSPNWNITPAWLTVFVVLAIYRTQRI
jgi:hypothetical protein